MQHKSASLSAQESMFNLTHKKKKRRRKECQQEKQTNKQGSIFGKLTWPEFL